MEVPAKRITNRNDRLGRFILNCFVILNGSPLEKEIESLSAAKPGERVYDVKLLINGLEVPIEEVVDYWMKRCEEGVSYAAAELIKDKMDSIDSKLMDAQEKVERILDNVKTDVVKEFGLTYDPYEDTIS